MGKTRDFFKKIEDTKETFHARMGMRKDRNSKDLTETKDTKKKWQEYTGELSKKGLNDLDNHNVVGTHLEPDTWSVRSNGPQEAVLQVKFVEVTEFPLSGLKSPK